MRVVYEPENLIDAHLVKGVLEQSGIPVYLRGEHLAGGIGELPVFGLFALCVPEACEAMKRTGSRHWRNWRRVNGHRMRWWRTRTAVRAGRNFRHD